MRKNDLKKLAIEFLPTSTADNEFENSATLIQLMVTVATVGLRVDKNKNCCNMKEESKHEETTKE